MDFNFYCPLKKIFPFQHDFCYRWSRTILDYMKLPVAKNVIDLYHLNFLMKTMYKRMIFKIPEEIHAQDIH